MKSLVEDTTRQRAQEDREKKASYEILAQMQRAGWDIESRQGAIEFERRMKDRFPYLEGPPDKPAEKRNKTMEEGSYNPVPSRELTSMRIQDYGYM